VDDYVHFLNQLLEQFWISDAALHKARTIDTAKIVGVAGDKIVQHRDSGPQCDQSADQIGADEARSACYQHRFASQVVKGHHETHEIPLHPICYRLSPSVISTKGRKMRHQSLSPRIFVVPSW
jgi:hypothetical protein